MLYIEAYRHSEITQFLYGSLPKYDPILYEKKSEQFTLLSEWCQFRPCESHSVYPTLFGWYWNELHSVILKVTVLQSCPPMALCKSSMADKTSGFSLFYIKRYQNNAVFLLWIIMFCYRLYIFQVPFHVHVYNCFLVTIGERGNLNGYCR